MHLEIPRFLFADLHLPELGTIYYKSRHLFGHGDQLVPVAFRTNVFHLDPGGIQIVTKPDLPGEPLIIDTDGALPVQIIPPVWITLCPDILIAELYPVYQNLVASEGPVHKQGKCLLARQDSRPTYQEVKQKGKPLPDIHFNYRKQFWSETTKNKGIIMRIKGPVLLIVFNRF